MTQAAGKRILPNTVNQIKTKNNNTKLIFKRENRDLSTHTPLEDKIRLQKFTTGKKRTFHK